MYSLSFGLSSQSSCPAEFLLSENSLPGTLEIIQVPGNFLFILFIQMDVQMGIGHFNALCIKHGLDVLPDREEGIPVMLTGGPHL